MVTEEQLDYYLLPGDWPGLRELSSLTTVEYIRWVLATEADQTGPGRVFYSPRAIKRKLLRFTMFESGARELFAIASLVGVRVNGSFVPSFKFDSVEEKMIWLLKYGGDTYTL